MPTPHCASTNTKILGKLLARQRGPQDETISWFDRGGLVGYGDDRLALYWRAATYVDKILTGAKPNDIPVELPTSFELVVSLKTAEALGITLPPSILLRATEVIE